jgi:hypothetical protein
VTPGLGRVAYEAYSASTGGTSAVTGAVLPDWSVTTVRIREAWNAAAEAVVRSYDANGRGSVVSTGTMPAADVVVIPPDTPQPG